MEEEGYEILGQQRHKEGGITHRRSWRGVHVDVAQFQRGCWGRCALRAGMLTWLVLSWLFSLMVYPQGASSSSSSSCSSSFPSCTEQHSVHRSGRIADVYGKGRSRTCTGRRGCKGATPADDVLGGKSCAGVGVGVGGVSMMRMRTMGVRGINVDGKEEEEKEPRLTRSFMALRGGGRGDVAKRGRGSEQLESEGMDASRDWTRNGEEGEEEEEEGGGGEEEEEEYDGDEKDGADSDGGFGSSSAQARREMRGLKGTKGSLGGVEGGDGSDVDSEQQRGGDEHFVDGAPIEEGEGGGEVQESSRDGGLSLFSWEEGESLSQGIEDDPKPTKFHPPSPMAVPFATSHAEEKILAYVLRASVRDMSNIRARAAHEALPHPDHYLVETGISRVNKALRRGIKNHDVEGESGKGIMVIASDVVPFDLIAHLPVCSEDVGLPYIFVSSKSALGRHSILRYKRTCAALLLVRPSEGEAKMRSKFDRVFERVMAVQHQAFPGTTVDVVTAQDDGNDDDDDDDDVE
jgi:ribosomal protein L7Ae-like RNA K-turn-binding protein